MSAPRTNIEKQERRHRGPLIGIAIVVVFALLTLLARAMFVSEEAGVPEGADEQVNTLTGEVDQQEQGDAGSGVFEEPPSDIDVVDE